MQAVVGAILILAGSVLFGSAIITHGIGSIPSFLPVLAGYVLGALLSAIGLAVFLAAPLKRLWGMIPLNDPKPKGRE